MAERGPKVLLLGGSGSGKTYATASLAETGLRVCFLWMEPGCHNSVARYFSDRGKPIPDGVHWATAPLAMLSFKEMIDMATRVNTSSQQLLASMVDTNRGKHTAFIKVLEILSSYRCERTGKDLGPVDGWGNDTVLVFESLSTLSDASMRLVIGGRPLASQGDWQIAMNGIEQFVNKLVSLDCGVVLTSHLDRETDEQVGGTKLMAATLGRKLAPKIPRYFDDVIHAKREGTKFTWATDTTDVDLKTRLLPIKNGLEPSFVPLVGQWRKLAGLTSPASGIAAG